MDDDVVKKVYKRGIVDRSADTDVWDRSIDQPINQSIGAAIKVKTPAPGWRASINVVSQCSSALAWSTIRVACVRVSLPASGASEGLKPAAAAAVGRGVLRLLKGWA